MPNIDDWDVTDILTAMGLVEWLLWNDPDNPHQSPVAAQVAARWACALHEAHFLASTETSTVKDIAQVLYDGHSGFKSLLDVANYLPTLTDESEYAIQEISERARARTSIAIEFQSFLKGVGYHVQARPKAAAHN